MNRRDFLKMAGMSAFAFMLHRNAGAAESKEGKAGERRKKKKIKEQE